MAANIQVDASLERDDRVSVEVRALPGLYGPDRVTACLRIGGLELAVGGYRAAREDALAASALLRASLDELDERVLALAPAVS